MNPYRDAWGPASFVRLGHLLVDRRRILMVLGHDDGHAFCWVSIDGLKESERVAISIDDAMIALMGGS